jgi:hypothetical protein
MRWSGHFSIVMSSSGTFSHLVCHRITRIDRSKSGATEAEPEIAGEDFHQSQRPNSPRFGVSRRERFEKVERPALKALPSTEYDGGEWKTAKPHPDCYVAVDGDYYSAPHIHRGKRLRIKLTEHHVEIFLHLERLAIHPRCRQKMGMRIKILAHFPANSVAFYEATPQKLLSQSRFIHHLELFNADVYAHIRRAMGLASACTKEIGRSGHTLANEHIARPSRPCAATTASARRTTRSCSSRRANSP